MKQYLVKLSNGYYFIASSTIDYSVGDNLAQGIIIQVGIQIKEHGQHFNIDRVKSNKELIDEYMATFEE
jgi:hypothetical protein